VGSEATTAATAATSPSSWPVTLAGGAASCRWAQSATYDDWSALIHRMGDAQLLARRGEHRAEAIEAPLC